MSLKLIAFGPFVAAVLMCGQAFAQSDADQPKIDCKNAQTQTDMNTCAALDFQRADKALNEQYKKTRTAMVAIDADLDADIKGAEKALVKAQRAWIDFRDSQCEAEGFEARGGTMEPLLISGCKTTLTQQRTKELKVLADGSEGAQ
ncbi:uncharacterized protein YecT (DUF1311 family) [Rhizobium sp. SG741]|nr:uncharacterized protein YecT (DUF1311 family) [Rhizobium sp. SG741]